MSDDAKPRPVRASADMAGQPTEQTLSRVVLMGMNSATKQLQPLTIDPETGSFAISAGVSAVTATAPITSSGGSAPVIALTAGTNAQMLISNGTAYSSQTISGDITTTNAGVVAIGANKITDAMLRQGVARSVIGRSADSTGNVADISLATNGKFLGSRASAIGAFYPTQRLSKSTAYPLTQDDYGALVDCDTTSAGFTVTLPAPGTVGAGWWCALRKTIATNVLTIARNASETINGASASNTLNSQYSYITLMCDGTNWAILAVNDWLTVIQTSVVNLSNGIFVNCTSLSVPPGEWDMTGIFVFNINGSTSSGVSAAAISTNSGNTTTDHVFPDNYADVAFPPATNAFISIPNYRLVLTSTTTVYHKGNMTFSAGTPQIRGRLSARRVG